MSGAKEARRLDWRVYDTHRELDALLEETGGEVTAEVEALENRLAEDLDELAAVAVAMKKDADAEEIKVKAERARLTVVSKRQKGRIEYAKRLLRRVAREREVKSFPVGTRTVRMDPPSARVVESGPADADALVAIGCGRFDFKPDKKAIGARLLAGKPAPGYVLVTPDEPKVVIS